jgi:DNA-binding MarR family transcriptional regulator
MSRPAAGRAAIGEALIAALRDASGKSVLLSQAIADRVGMNPTDLESLDLLIRGGPMTAGQLAERTGLTTGAVTGLIDRLERHGYARRERHPTDRRSVLVRPLTGEVERDLSPAYAAIDRTMQELLTRYSDEELAVILDFMTRSVAATDEWIAALRAEAAAGRAR